ncbi:MAG: sarcosine oxidase subunit alpha family protein [Rhodobacteraceae bacterium]|nr:sarcosine oxidase subunit alpha family protein [Paracoccaceae bacterium]
MSRLAKGGQIDRSQSVPFSFDGRTLIGHAGDTLASALIANDVKLVARSFKYHRPRGILTAGSEEPNALVGIGTGDQITPNVRATMQEVYRGLAAHSQNHLGPLAYDLLAVNDLMAPFFGAGFYYKTFMWPKAFWEKIYEPLIRRAAGIGALSGVEDRAAYDKAFAFCDVLVIGAGPAGLMAALVAAKGGADVILADEDFRMGGRLNADMQEVDGKPGADWAADTVADLAAMDNVRLMPRTTITGAYDGSTYGALQRVSHHIARPGADLPLETFWRIVAKRTILAGGALERPIAFPDNDRPGIMLASGLRSYVNRFAATPGQAVSLFTNNDNAHQTARDLQDAGVRIAAVIDSRADAKISGDFPVLTGASVIATKGRKALRGITVQTTSGIRNIETDCLAVSGGWNPSVHLTCHMNGKPVWREDIAAFVPSDGAIPGMIVAGAAGGDFSTHAALKTGADAAKAVLKDLFGKAPRITLPKAEDAPGAMNPFWHVSGGKGRAWLDLANDVTTKDVALAHRENFRSVEHLKRYTTLGMAPDQGKLSNLGALAIMAELTGQTIPETGTTIFRPPYTPVAIGALGAHGKHKGFAPERFIPSDALAREQGARFVEAGLWYRPSWFPARGETHWRQSCDREVNMVRSSVGLCDVTTLGKIDIQGPDAAEFLDRVYANMFSTLKVGRVRYGLMLREDGMVMDDGTSARFSDTHFVMTTTTAAAGQVMTHLDFCAQVLWPELDVQFISVTEQWAQFAVAGPRSRELLAGLCDTAITDEAFPYMSCGEVSIGAVRGRLFRISFSGEHAYEIAVPARYGDALARALDGAAKALGGGWYGMEALNVLRLEKGFITHAEIHGRVTADDIGMGRMVSAKKDCVGKVMSQRPGLSGPEREQLVALKPVGAVKQFGGGAHLFNEGEPQVRENDQGYITSHCFSPTLGHPIALAFVKNGHARIGEHIRMKDYMRDIETICKICPPVHLDPEGGKLRG